MQKLTLALVIAVRKLRPYFQSHSITVVTASPMQVILHKPKKSGWMAKWAIELSEFDITYKPRTALKSQVLADFVAEFATRIDVKAPIEVPIA